MCECRSAVWHPDDNRYLRPGGAENGESSTGGRGDCVFQIHGDRLKHAASTGSLALIDEIICGVTGKIDSGK